VFELMTGKIEDKESEKVERQIDSDTYQPSMILDIVLTVSIVAVGIFLVTYFIRSL